MINLRVLNRILLSFPRSPKIAAKSVRTSLAVFVAEKRESILVQMDPRLKHSGMTISLSDLNDKGVTLVELLIAMLIGSIAFFALAAPFMAERRLWKTGLAQTEAQRDAQFILHYMARAARASGGYTIDPGGAGIKFYSEAAKTNCRNYFAATPTSTHTLDLSSVGCSGSPTDNLIDGVRSKVTDFVVTPVNSKLVRLQLEVTQDVKNEKLQTELFLRNA